MLKAVETMALSMHNRHYERNPGYGPVDPKESPNENTIYHVFNDGTVEYTKGGHAYMQRSIFTSGYPVLTDAMKSKISFPMRYPFGSPADSYVQLTEKEADAVRAEMRRIAMAAVEQTKPIESRILHLHEDTASRQAGDVKLARLYNDGSIFEVNSNNELVATKSDPVPNVRLRLRIAERDGSSYCVVPLHEALQLRTDLLRLASR